MPDLKALIAGYAQTGTVRWIGLRPARRMPLQAVGAAFLTETGLEGDHGRAGKRAMTLVQAEHLAVIGAFLNRAPVTADTLRRNIAVCGINLSALKGRHIRIGAAIVSIEVMCAPCSRMEEALGQGGYSAVRGHGGWCASVVSPGQIKVGDIVQPL